MPFALLPFSEAAKNLRKPPNVNNVVTTHDVLVRVEVGLSLLSVVWQFIPTFSFINNPVVMPSASFWEKNKGTP